MRFVLSGLVVETDAELPGVPAVDAAPDLTVTVEGVRRVPATLAAGARLQAVKWGDELQYSTVRRDDGSVLLRLHGVVDFVIDTDLRTVRAWTDPSCEPELYALLVTGNLLATVLLLRGETVLHASAVERDGRAVAFVAHSGGGKSTLAALACAGGARFVTDDLLRLHHAGDGRLRCWPGGAENRLRRPLAEIVGSAPDTSVRTSVDGRQVWRPRATGAALPELVAVVLPELDHDGGDLALRPLGRAAALVELARRPRLLGWTDPATSAHAFADLAALVRAVPVFAARVPAGLPVHPDVVDELLAGAGLPVGVRPVGVLPVSVPAGSPTPAR